MSDDIKIGITSETQAFTAGVKSGVVKPLQDVEKAADDAGKAGDDAGDQITKAMQDAQNSTTKLSREYKQTARDIQEASRTSSRAVQTDFDDTERRGAESFKELGNEGRQNLSETLSSFDGSTQSFIDGIQGTFGGIVSSLPGIGAAAGVAGALGIGLISSAFQNAQAEADLLKQRTQDAFDDMIESGNQYVSTNFTNEALKDLTQDQAKVNQATKDAKALDLDRATILRAQVGDAQALLDVHYAILAKSQDIKQLKDSELNTDGSQTLALSDQLDSLSNIGNRYKDIEKSNDTAAKNAQLYLDATKQTADGTAQIATNVKSIPDLKNISVNLDMTNAKKQLATLPNTIDITPIIRDPYGVRVR
jgi:hypothetical protein